MSDISKPSNSNSSKPTDDTVVSTSEQRASDVPTKRQTTRYERIMNAMMDYNDCGAADKTPSSEKNLSKPTTRFERMMNAVLDDEARRKRCCRRRCPYCGREP